MYKDLASLVYVHWLIRKILELSFLALVKCQNVLLGIEIEILHLESKRNLQLILFKYHHEVARISGGIIWH